MAFSGFDRQLIGELRRTGATWQQTYLVQRILRAISKTSLFSQYVSSAGGMSADLPRVLSALTSFADGGQPSRALVRGLCDGAAATVQRVITQWGHHQVLMDLVVALRDTALSIADQQRPLDQQKVLTRAAAATVAARLPEVRSLVDAALAGAWKRAVSAAYVDTLADELACLAATADRDPVELTDDLTRALRVHDGLDIDMFRRLLLPGLSAYRVAVVVHGTTELSALEALHPTAVSAPVRQPERLGPRLARFARRVAVRGPACLVACEVQAVDTRSAARAARRELSELLDQYMAGHRLIELTLGDDAFVSRVDSGTARHLQTHPPTVQRAVPLVSQWPPALRNGLRMAHVARTTEAPLPAAALAWAALEASGLTKREDIAAALSLQAMRQQVVEAHRQLRRGVATLPGEAREHADDLLRRIDQHTGSDEFGRVRDVTKWVELLLPVQTSLAELLEQVPPLAAQQVLDWSARLADPAECARWLEDRRQRVETLLHALNTTRNMALHTGQFRAFGDLALGVSGSLVVDFTLEILGNWYRNSTDALPPARVISQLAVRQRDVVAALRARTGPVDLDIGWLTSPVRREPPGGRAGHQVEPRGTAKRDLATATDLRRG
ncbi:hypothetical protein [Kibdelosporangium phytohabitans]|uniref:hypothetical protein n=1 Tax=Kibdelosporangium phytohabitans TaxID=860235 RepID=UPI0012F877AA|nr:hypothetical protein [Kibdelosporangium phytohabitans]MBE1462151.1 hypothetical protein [Kibdelosporangium phytohabitans]